MRTTVAEHLAALLKRHGVEFAFGIPGGDWLPYMDAMRRAGIRFVLVANEASAGFMAAVHAWYRPAPGLCFATFGPGATNLATGIGGAYLDRAAVLALTHEQPDAMAGRTVQMGIDHQALMRPLTKWSVRLGPANIDAVLAKAVGIATAEQPGPVHIGIPAGIAEAECEATEGEPASRPALAPPEPRLLASMERLLAGKAKPLLAVGPGALRFGLGPLVEAVAARHRLPVVVTPMAKGVVDEDGPSYAGTLMHALSDRVALTYSQADIVIGVGYDPVEFNYEEWMPPVPLVSVDPTPADIDPRAYPSVLSVGGDPRPALEALLGLPPLDSAWDLGAMRRRREEMFAAFLPGKAGFGPLAAVAILRELLPEDGILACDVGAHSHLLGQAWKARHPYGFLISNGWSSMGFGVPAAIAAKLSMPDRKVACVTGDGGFMMMAGEMATARRLGLPIVFIVMADRSLSLIRIKQMKRGEDEGDTALGPAGMPGMGNVFGVPAFTVGDASSYRAALAEALEAEGPVIIEALIDPREYEGLVLRKHR